MSYRGVGAGPGPVEKYKVDAPFPWGDDTEITLPIQELVNDAWSAVTPRINELEAKLIEDMENEASLYAPRIVKQVMDSVVTPEMNRQMEVAFAELDMMETDALKALIAVGASMVLAVGLAAWWVKKG